MSFRTFVNSISIWPDQNSLYFPFSASFSFLCIYIDKRNSNWNKSEANEVEPLKTKPQNVKVLHMSVTDKATTKAKVFYTHIELWIKREKEQKTKNDQKLHVSWWNDYFYSSFPESQSISFICWMFKMCAPFRNWLFCRIIAIGEHQHLFFIFFSFLVHVQHVTCYWGKFNLINPLG